MTIGKEKRVLTSGYVWMEWDQTESSSEFGYVWIRTDLSRTSSEKRRQESISCGRAVTEIITVAITQSRQEADALFGTALFSRGHELVDLD